MADTTSNSAFRFGTWNVLATAYIRPEFYPHTPAEVLDPTHRIPALAQRAAALDTDILCLQEVEAESFAAFEAALGAGIYAPKAAGKPDGCAAFYRPATCQLLESRRLVFEEGAGHIAQVLSFRVGEMNVQAINTHLKWDPPQAHGRQRWGYRQALQILDALETGGVQIVCGDFNVTPEDEVAGLFQDAGFTHAHKDVFSCNSNRRPKLIDYIFFRGPVQVHPLPVAPIAADTPLPSWEEPSDHLPLLATLQF